MSANVEDQLAGEFFDLSGEMLCIARLDGLVCRLNAQWVTSLGYSIESLRENTLADLVHSDDKASLVAAIARLKRQGTVSDCLHRFRSKSGTYSWLEWRARVVGESGYVLIAAKDCTQKLRTDSYLQKLSEVSGIGFWEIDLATEQLFLD